jgi:hypothetical protein
MCVYLMCQDPNLICCGKFSCSMFDGWAVRPCGVWNFHCITVAIIASVTWCFVVWGKRADISEISAIMLHSSHQKSLCYTFIMAIIVFINAGLFLIKCSLICILKWVKHGRIMCTNLKLSWGIYGQTLQLWALARMMQWHVPTALYCVCRCCSLYKCDAASDNV